MLGEPAAPATGWTPAAPLAPSSTSSIRVGPRRRIRQPRPPASAPPDLLEGLEGDDMLWQQTGHDGSAAQYPDWKVEGHANALTGLTSQSFWGFLPEATKQECLECHSTDYRILEEAGENPTSADAQYGVTCVGLPHAAREHHPGRRVGRGVDSSAQDRLGQDALRRVPQRGDPRGHDGLAGRRDPSSDEGDDGRLRRHRRLVVPERPQGQVRPVPHAADERQPRQRAAGW